MLFGENSRSVWHQFYALHSITIYRGVQNSEKVAMFTGDPIIDILLNLLQISSREAKAQ